MVYVNKTGGGGGGSSNPGSSYSAVLKIPDPSLDLELSYVLFDEEVNALYLGIPSINAVGSTLELTMLNTVLDVEILSDEESVFDPESITKNGKTMTIDFLTAPTIINEGNPMLKIKAGGIEYIIGFFGAAYFLADVGAQGSMTVYDTFPEPHTVTGTETFSRIGGPAVCNFTPQTGYVRSDFTLTRLSGTPVSVTPVGYDYHFFMENEIYDISVSFEQKATATVEGLEGNWYLDQNMIDEHNIFMYIPASEFADKKIFLDLKTSLNTSSIENEDAVSNIALNGTVAEITMESDSDLFDLESGGVNPTKKTLTVTATNGDVYNIYLLKSAKVIFEFGTETVGITYNGNDINVTTGSAVMDLVFITFDSEYIQVRVSGGIWASVGLGGTFELEDKTYVFKIMATPL